MNDFYHHLNVGMYVLYMRINHQNLLIMKKILVPTDFSIPAKNALIYAMHLAKEMQVDVKLCNAIMFPVDVPMAGEVSWPMVEYSTLERESTQDLKTLAKKVEGLFEMELAVDSFHPKLECVTGVGPVCDVVNNFSDSRSVTLIIMGMLGAGGFTQFLLGSSSRAMVETAKIPVLLIPKEFRFRTIQKIAFATDLSEKDIALIEGLADLARKVNAELLLVHVSDQAPEGNSKNQKKIDAFLNEITNKVNYHKIYYEHVWNVGIDNGLEWLSRQGEVSILAMVHRKHHILYRIFKGSHTQRVKNRIQLPLLVLPEILKKKI